MQNRYNVFNKITHSFAIFLFKILSKFTNIYCAQIKPHIKIKHKKTHSYALKCSNSYFNF